MGIRKGIIILIKKNKGSLTIEASLALIVFIFAFLSILYLCKFVRAQVVLQHCVNQVAKEISQYSYLTNKLGLKNDKSKSENMIKETDKLISEASNLISLINSEKDEVADNNEDYEINDYYDAIRVYRKYDDDGNKIKDSYSNIEDATISFIGVAGEYLKDPKALLKGFVAIAKDEIADFAVSKFIAAPLSTLLVQKYLPRGQASVDEYLLKLGINGGLEGLNFDTSTIFKSGSDIDITLIYNMTLKLPFFPERTLCFRVNASTVGWQSSIFKIESNEYDTPVQRINIWDYSWKIRTNEFIKALMKDSASVAVRTPISLDFYDYSSNTFTYVHSMNTELKSYSNNGELNLLSIKKQLIEYVKDAIYDTQRATSITMENGTVYDTTKVKNNKNIKIKMIMKDTATGSIDELNKIIVEIIKELNCNNLEVDFTFHDGIVNPED